MDKKRHEVRVSSAGDHPADDGHSWRKYGQKEILGAKHPRWPLDLTHPPIKKKRFFFSFPDSRAQSHLHVFLSQVESKSFPAAFLSTFNGGAPPLLSC